MSNHSSKCCPSSLLTCDMRSRVAAELPGVSTELPRAPRASSTLWAGPSRMTPHELVFLMRAKEAQASSCDMAGGNAEKVYFKNSVLEVYEDSQDISRPGVHRTRSRGLKAGEEK
eukprot:1158203-Pelagomonas_calceolata.AAC.12